MSFENAIASVAVRDLKASAKWYERLLGRPADSHPMAEVFEWKFPRGGWLQVYELPERAGATSCTLAVTDFEEQLRKLKEMEVNTDLESSGEKARVVMVTDPDGNHLAIAQALDPTMAR